MTEVEEKKHTRTLTKTLKRSFQVAPCWCFERMQLKRKQAAGAFSLLSCVFSHAQGASTSRVHVWMCMSPRIMGEERGIKKKNCDRKSSDGGKTASTSVNMLLPTSPLYTVSKRHCNYIKHSNKTLISWDLRRDFHSGTLPVTTAADGLFFFLL